MSFTHAVSTNNYGPAKFIIDSDPANGTHTTIAAALSVASSGDTIFIRPGTYTEDLTLVPGVNLTAYVCDAFTPNVSITGKCTLSAAGTVTCSGIRFNTNGDYAVDVTGSAASILNLTECWIQAVDNDAVNMDCSDSGSALWFRRCHGDTSTTGLAFFTVATAGMVRVNHSFFFNTGASTTPSTVSSGNIFHNWSGFTFPFSVSGTGGLVGGYSSFDCTTFVDETCVATTSTSSNAFIAHHCALLGNTETALTIGAGAQANLYECLVQSNNSAAISGAGTLLYGGVTFNSSSTVTVTTQTPVVNFIVKESFNRQELHLN